MAKASAESPSATPPSALKKTTSSAQNMKSQKSILGFFQKSSPATPSSNKAREPASSPAQKASERGANSVKPTPKRSFSSFAQDLSPVPSSDLPIPEEDEENGDNVKVGPSCLSLTHPVLTFVISPERAPRSPGCHNVSFASGERTTRDITSTVHHTNLLCL